MVMNWPKPWVRFPALSKASFRSLRTRTWPSAAAMMLETPWTWPAVPAGMLASQAPSRKPSGCRGLSNAAAWARPGIERPRSAPSRPAFTRGASNRLIVGLPQPSQDFRVDLRRRGDLDPVGEHRVERAGWLEAAAGRPSLQDQAEIQPRARRRLEEGELLAPAQAHIGLLRRDLHVRPKRQHRAHDLLVEGAKAVLPAGEKMRHGIVRRSRGGVAQHALG